MAETLDIVVPPSKAVGDPSKPRGKVLVVEADYFALTSRIDPNVIFWNANETHTTGEIPKGVTHLWISSYTNDEIRERLLFQAKRLGITVWPCGIWEMRRRLLPFWEDPSNRSVVDPASNENGVSAHLLFTDEPPSPSFIVSLPSQTGRLSEPVTEEDEQEESEEMISTILKRERAGAPRLAWTEWREQMKKRQGKRAELQGTAPPTAPSVPPVVPSTPDWLTALDKLPDLDRQIFSLVHGINTGRPPQTPAAVAEEFGLPEANLQRVLARVLARLEPHGFVGH